MAPADNSAGSAVIAPPGMAFPLEREAVPFQRTLATAFLPNLAAMLACAALVYCLFVFGGDRLFRDSDTGWHVRNGEQILQSHALPHSDPYSFSKTGAPWVAWEWGSDVLMGLAHGFGGLRGLAVLMAVAISASVWMWCRLAFLLSGDFLLTALLAVPTVTTLSLHWLARPHIFSWLFLAGALWHAERHSRENAGSGLLVAAVATALWANIHASFFMGPAIALCYAASHLVRPVLWQMDRDAEFRRAAWFLKAFLATMAASLLNPQGWRLHAHVFSYLTDSQLLSRVAEFQSFNFHDPDAWQVALTLILAAAGGTLALAQKKVAHVLIVAGLVWGGLRSARVIPLIALLAIPLAIGAFSEALRSAQGLRAPVRRALNNILDYSAGLKHFETRVSGVAFYVAVALLMRRRSACAELLQDFGLFSQAIPGGSGAGD